MLNALKFRINQMLFLTNFLLFLLFYFLYIYLLSETQIKIIYLAKILIFLFFLLILLNGNFLKNLFYLLPFSLIFRLTVYINYEVNPTVLKHDLSKITVPFKIFNIFILIFGFLLILSFLSGNRLKEKIPLLKTLFFYNLWAFLSIIWSYKKDYAFLVSFLLLINLLYYIAGYIYLKEEKDLNRFLLSLLVFLSFNIIISLLQYFFPEFPLSEFFKIEKIGYYWSQRARGIFYNSNSYSGFLIISIIFIFGFALFKKNKKLRFFLFFIILISVLSLVLTLSRSGYLSLFLAFILYYILYIIKKRKYQKIFLFATFVIPLIFLLFLLIKTLLPQIYLRIISIFWGKRDISILVRILFWKTSIKLFFQNPLTGIGLGQFAFQKVSHIHLHAHNAFLNILAELGLPGLLIFLSIILSIFKFLFKLYLNIESDKIHLIIGLLVGWVIIIFQLIFDFYWLNPIMDMEIKFFIIYLFLTFLLPQIYLKEYVKR